MFDENPSERRRCQKQGHKWITAIDGYLLPYWLCKRWFCGGYQMSPELAAALTPGDTK